MSLIKVETYSHKKHRSIAAVQYLDDEIRVSFWGMDGPHGHFSCKTKYALYEELAGYRADPQAEQRLEAWSKTSRWQAGLKEAQYLTFWNHFSRQGRSDLCVQLEAAPTLDAALKLAAQLLHDELPNAQLF
jgi:hypothetical protein